MKKISLFDIDDTLYKGGIIFPLMESEVLTGLLEKRYLDEVYHNKMLYQKDKLEYEELSKRVVIIWAKGLQNKYYTKVAKHAEEFILGDISNFYPFTKPLLAEIKKNYDTAIITNEPQFVSDPIKKLFSFDSSISTIFEVYNGVLTGSVSRFNSSKRDKKVSIHEIFEKYSRKDSFAFGDSIGDIGMFEEVTYPVCVNASTKLKEIAIKNNWNLVTSDSILDFVSKKLFV